MLSQRRRRVAVGLVALVGLALTGFAVASTEWIGKDEQPSPNATLRSATNRLESSDRAEVVSAIDPSALKGFGGIDAVLPLGTRVETLRRGIAVTTSAATVPAVLISADGSRRNVRLQFAREGVTWRVISSEARR